MVTEYLGYLWELGELPVYIIGGVGIAWEPGSNGLAIACTWRSSPTNHINTPPHDIYTED